MIKSQFYRKLPEKFNLAQYLLEPNIEKGLGNKKAFYCDSTCDVTYKELLEYTSKFARLLAQQSLTKGDRVAILLPDSLQFILSFLGAIWGGFLPVLINEFLAVGDVVSIINDSRASILITTEENKEKIYSCLAQKCNILVFNNKMLFNILENNLNEVISSNTLKNDRAFIIYTSGSNGKPKGVVHSHINPIIAAENCAKKLFQFNEADIIYSAPPMSFGYALGTSLYMSLYVGASSIVSETNNPFGFIKIINRYKPSIFCGVPDNFAKILAISDISSINNNNLRLYISSGEKLPEKLSIKWYQHYECNIYDGVGSSEAMHMYLANSPRNIQFGSSGKIVPGYSARLIDEQGVPVSIGNVGNLWITGENFMLEYWNDHQATNKVLCGNSLNTRDLYRMDEKGYYYYIGRQDNLLKINGMWISVAEIEKALLEFDEIHETAVIFLNEKTMISETTELAALLVLKTSSLDHKFLINKIIKDLKNKLPKYKVPRRFHSVEALPRTASGKVNYNQALQMVAKLVGSVEE